MIVDFFEASKENGGNAVIAEELVQLFQKKLERRSRRFLKQNHRDIMGFRKRLKKSYSKAFDLIAVIINITLEMASNFRHDASQIEDETQIRHLDVLQRLHARACQLAAEIFHLLQGGFADGAMGRWRTLHEIAVTIKVISKFGVECSERYTDHEIMHLCREMETYEKCCSHFGLKPIKPEQLSELNKRKAEVTGLYDEAFMRDYGWASKFINKKNKVTFWDLEKEVGLESYRYLYVLASSDIHCGSNAIFNRLGLLEHALDTEVLLAGASNVGLTIPGTFMIATLHEATSCLLNMSSWEDKMFDIIVNRYMQEINRYFVEAEDRIETLERKIADSKVK